MKIARAVRLALVPAALALAPTGASADSVADFYNGKTVKIVVGASMGGSYGLLAQIMSRHVSRHLAGAPTVVVQSMPGSGGNKAMNYTYTAGPQDGSVVSIVQISVVQESLFNPKIRFSAKGYQYFGRFTNANIIGTAHKRSGLKSWEDIRKKSYTIGSVGRRNYTYIGPALMNALAGAKFKIISGYRGTKQSYLAMEKAEVDAAATSWATLNLNNAKEMSDGTYIPLFQMMGYREDHLKDVPSIAEFGKTKGEKAFVAIIAAGSAIGRTMAGPPGMPKDRVAAWRNAFWATVNDPAFVADIKKRNSRLNPLNANDITKIIDDAMNLPKEDVKAAYAFYQKLLKATY
jgi:tripartite-type tricarboxylate transporter receptor subunit TctC